MLFNTLNVLARTLNICMSDDDDNDNDNNNNNNNNNVLNFQGGLYGKVLWHVRER